MIEKIILDYLNETLSVPAYMEIPKDAPTRFVVIEKTGSSLRNHIKDAIFAVQSYADSLYDAAVLNEELKQTMLSAVALDDIVSVRLNTDYNYTDSTTKQYRYQAVFEITHY